MPPHGLPSLLRLLSQLLIRADCVVDGDAAVGVKTSARSANSRHSGGERGARDRDVDVIVNRVGSDRMVGAVQVVHSGEAEPPRTRSGSRTVKQAGDGIRIRDSGRGIDHAEGRGTCKYGAV